MKLRFRGVSWDASVAATCAAPSRAQIVPAPAGTQPNSLLSLKDILQKEGVPPQLAFPLGCLLGPQASTGLDSSWSCAVAIKRDRIAQDAIHLGSERPGDPAGGIEEPELMDSNQESPPRKCHEDRLAAVAAAVCCLVSSDPAIAIESELSFLTFLLADRHLRTQLLSGVYMQPGGERRTLRSGVDADFVPADHRAGGVVGVGHDRSLSDILRCLREARPLPRGEKRCLPRAGPECTPQLRFEQITVDSDELEQFPRRRIHPGGGSNGGWCSPRIRAGERNVHTRTTEEAGHSQLPEPASWSIPVSSWDALDIAPLLKEYPMPRLSELRVDYALSPMWATPAEPRAMRINWPTRNKPTRRRVGSGDDTIDDTIVASTYQAIRCSRNMPGGKSNDFVRISVDDSAAYGDLQLQPTRKGSGLLDVLGDAAGEICVAAVGTPSFGATSATENSFGDFQPDKPSPGSLRHTLFPERYPQIPLSVAEATFGGRATRGENKTKRPTASGLGAHGQQGNPQRAHQTILAVLSAAIRETETVPFSSLSYKWPSVRMPGAGLDLAVGKTHKSTPFKRPVSLSPTTVSKPRDASNVMTNRLLVDILAVWRKSYAKAYGADATTRAEPHHIPDAPPVVSMFSATVPPHAPPKPPTFESAHHPAFPSNRKAAVSSDTPLPQLTQVSSASRGSGQSVVRAEKEPVERVEPVQALKPVEPVKLIGTVGAPASMRTEGGGSVGASASIRTRDGGAVGASASRRTHGEGAVVASPRERTENRLELCRTVGAKSIRSVGVSGSRPSHCKAQSGSNAVSDDPESRHRVEATGLQKEHRPVSTNRGDGEDRAVSTNEGRAEVEPSVGSGRKRRKLDESCRERDTDEVIPKLPRGRFGGGEPDKTGSVHVDSILAKRSQGKRFSLPSFDVVSNLPRRMRASTRSVSTPAPLQDEFQAADDQQGVDLRLTEGVSAMPLPPPNAQGGRRQHPSPGEESTKHAVPIGLAVSEPAVSERRSAFTCSQHAEVCRTSGDAAQVHQPRRPEAVASPSRSASAPSVKSKPEGLLDDTPRVARPLMGRMGGSTNGQEKPERPPHVVPSVSAAEEIKKVPDRSNGAEGENAEDEDAAMAGKLGCRSRRQREMLALFRAGSMEGTFALTRGCEPPGHTGRGTMRASAPVPSNAPVGRSGPGCPSVVPSVSTGLAGSDAELRTMRSGNRTGRHADRALYAVVSEEFVGKAGSLVMTLSTPQRGLKEGAAPFTAIQRLPNNIPGARGTDRFALLELPVEPPVDLVVGGRSAVVIIDNRELPSLTEGHGRGGDSSDAAVDVSDGGIAAAEMAETKKKLHLLTLQTLKYSTLWITLNMDKTPGSGTASKGGVLVCPAFERLEQWLVGFPCRVLIRYSNSEAQLAELIAHAALSEQRLAGTIAGTSTASPRNAGNRLRGGPSPRESSTLLGRSPLEVIENRSRNDPDWAAVHHRQAWFLQLFPALNAYSASALLSAASLKHLIVAPFEELAPCLLGKGRGAEGCGSGAGAARGGVNAESLRDFCAAVRLEEGTNVVDMN